MIKQIFVFITSLLLILPPVSFAQENTSEPQDLITRAVERVKLYSAAKNIPLSYIGFDIQQLTKSMVDPDKKRTLGQLNMARQSMLEELYYRSVWFEVEGNTAYMYGIIDDTLDEKVLDMFANHDIEEIVLVFVPGSRDDFTNFEVIKWLREKNITTRIHKKGFIASGGVDFLLAGTTRIVEPGARIGVHSWKYEDVTDANSLSKLDERHRIWLDFYRDIGMDTDYYWFVLDNATATQIYWIQEDELTQFNFRA